MSFRLLAAVCLLAGCVSLLPAQQRVDPRNLHERVLCVVPMIGAGTYDDPRRPLFAPAKPSEMVNSGMLGFSYQTSDDGKFALVEFVARDKKSFAGLADARVLKKFEKGKHRKEDIEKEFRKYKKDFDLNRFGGRAR